VLRSRSKAWHGKSRWDRWPAPLFTVSVWLVMHRRRRRSLRAGGLGAAGLAVGAGWAPRPREARKVRKPSGGGTSAGTPGACLPALRPSLGWRRCRRLGAAMILLRRTERLRRRLWPFPIGVPEFRTHSGRDGGAKTAQIESFKTLAWFSCRIQAVRGQGVRKPFPRREAGAVLRWRGGPWPERILASAKVGRGGSRRSAERCMPTRPGNETPRQLGRQLTHRCLGRQPRAFDHPSSERTPSGWPLKTQPSCATRRSSAR
jgi:hypothetical protein